MASDGDNDRTFTNEDGTVEVVAMTLDAAVHREVRKGINSYTWIDKDFVLAAYPQNGTNFMWEIMMMLLRGSAEYIKDSKDACMIDFFPISKIDESYPSPRVLNTHYRLDVLPEAFRGKKTVWVVRNPKDVAISYYFYLTNVLPDLLPFAKNFGDMALTEVLQLFLSDKNQPYGNYFDYTEYMWSLRDDPDMLVIFYEDLKLDPTTVIQKVNEFMGTKRSAEFIREVVEATNFSKMKPGKESTRIGAYASLGLFQDNVEEFSEAMKRFFRKGVIGDWKNHFTVADNEMFDSFLEKWTVGKEIPFKYC